MMNTTCENCQRELTLTTEYEDDFLIGDECVCGYWVSRYNFDEDDTMDCGCSEGMCYCEPEDDGYYYSGTGEWSEDDSYIDYLNR